SQQNVRLCVPKISFNRPKDRTSLTGNIALAISILTWLGFTEEDKDKESELIMTLKRAVLCTQREQYDKAEQMLHLALRLAQQQQNQQGIVYCYDLMANLAFETYELDKAEKLFVSVLQILLSNGMPQDDIKVIHISLKLARISQMMADMEKAEIGYKWCLNQIKNQKNHSTDAQILYGVINDWYAQFLLDKGEIKNALFYLKEAYNVYDLENAEKYLKEAISIGNNLEDKSHLGVVHANLGLILLQKGYFCRGGEVLRSSTEFGLVYCKKYDNTESVEQANYCFDQIKLNWGK
ncbi:hypothetical protein NQ317_009309, partial [Molorchus minor]